MRLVCLCANGGVARSGDISGEHGDLLCVRATNGRFHFRSSSSSRQLAPSLIDFTESIIGSINDEATEWVELFVDGVIKSKLNQFLSNYMLFEVSC